MKADESQPKPEATDAVAPAPEFPGRRSFIAVLIGVGTVAVGALLSVPLIRFVLYPLFAKTTETAWSNAGQIAAYGAIAAPVEVDITVERRDGWREVVSRKPVYVIPPHVGNHRVLSPICPHLGCEVAWVQDQRQFLCPCHGSVFAEDGARVSGPTPRGLDYLDSMDENGQLLVRYQYFRELVPDREVIG